MSVPVKPTRPARESVLATLAELASGLPDEALDSLREFAEFLVQKYPVAVKSEPVEVVPIERPRQETVIAAIRRLAKTYPMLDREVLFQQTSQAMSDHVLQAVPDHESIDRLETVFRREYEAYLEKHRA